MFARGHEDHIYMDMYSPEFEDFGGGPIICTMNYPID